MPGTNPKSYFLAGFRDCSPFILIVAPFGTLFGVVAVEAGLDLIETMSMTMLVIAGAAQFTAISLMQEQAPVAIVLLTAFAVNFRMAMYSAGLVPHLGRAPGWQRVLMSYFLVDQAFAVSLAKYEREPNLTMPQKVAYYIGASVPLASLWVVFSLIGAVVGRAIPPEYSLDFALPVCFIALSAPAMRSLPHFVAGLVSVIGALALGWVPWSMGLIIAALLAMMAGAETERRLKRGVA
ncbi:MAG: AzlC family ABC transporter permease [Rhodobacteraceae bacterium]|nr:AzlC family ABC transporter permease [Paracoccaceae bacterium]